MAGVKRARAVVSSTADAVDSDSSDDYGPRAPPLASASVPVGGAVVAAVSTVDVVPSPPPPPRKAPRVLANEAVILSALPCASAYEKSYMHRAVVTHVLVLARDDFVVTASADGVVKLWKKAPGELEFVKVFRAHLGPIASVVASADGARLASLGTADRALKFFDVAAFDMTDMITLDFEPAAAVWLCKPAGGGTAPLLVVSDRASPTLRIFDAERPQAGALHRLDTLHTAPVRCLAYNATHHMVVSADARGVLEYWSADSDSGFATPAALAQLRGSSSGSSGVQIHAPGADQDAPPIVFQYKTDTSLFELAKAKAAPQSLTVSKDGAAFVVTASDRLIRLFSFTSGRLLRVYDESLTALRATAASASAEEQQELWAPRLAAEAELLEASNSASAPAPPASKVVGAAVDTSASTTTAAVVISAAAAAAATAAAPPSTSNAVFDDSGHFLIFATAAGIKVVNTVTNSVSVVLGRHEGERFLAVALYQGTPRVSSQYALRKAEIAAAAAGSNYSATLNAKLAASGLAGGGGDAQLADATLLAVAHRRQRVYLFSRREPMSAGSAADALRDVFNEPPSASEIAVAAAGAAAAHRAVLCHEAVLHTSKGDIFFKLLPELAPKAVENFVGHARAGYFNGLTFHRVIQKFMIQTGDPKGDGTGGQSIWGREFEDEIDRSARFDRAGVLAMANAGPCTNGSQFFITCAPCAWLDGKHTIFGRVTRGMDAVHAIEGVAVDKRDKPLEPIRIVSVDVK